MTRSDAARVVAMVLGALGVALGVGVAVRRLPAAMPSGAPGPVASRAGARAARAPDTLLDAVVEKAPFRADRRPPVHDDGVPRDTSLVASGPAAPPSPPRPLLELAGIVWAREPIALVDGLPGTGLTQAMRVGETIQGIRVVRIGAEQVELKGLDTTWTLRVKRAW